MGVANRKYADFFVFTFEGYHLERTDFDNEFWSEMPLYLDVFWSIFVAPEILVIKAPKSTDNTFPEMDDALSHADINSIINSNVFVVEIEP